MLSLQDRNWRQFQAFGTEGLFDIHTTSSSIDSIRLIEGGNTVLPYVTRTDKNNGITRFVSDKNSSFGIDKAGTITVGLDTQTAFWQPHDYVTGQNIQVVSADVLTNPHVSAFVIPLLKMQMRAKFNWGGNGATLSRMKTLRIMLPTDMLGEPDWKFMEDYIRERETAQVERCREFLMKRIADIERERERE